MVSLPKWTLLIGSDVFAISPPISTFTQKNVKVNVTKWIASLIRQRVKLQELNHTIDDEYFITHIMAGLPEEYASVVDQAKIDQRASSLSLSELRKRLKEKYR